MLLLDYNAMAISQLNTILLLITIAFGLIWAVSHSLTHKTDRSAKIVTTYLWLTNSSKCIRLARSLLFKYLPDLLYFFPKTAPICNLSEKNRFHSIHVGFCPKMWLKRKVGLIFKLFSASRDLWPLVNLKMEIFSWIKL